MKEVGLSTDISNRSRDRPALSSCRDPTVLVDAGQELLARDGWHVELTGKSADGGIDIFALNRVGSVRHSMLVQAKRYASHRKVGVSVVREVLYLVERHRVNSGLIATTSHFTEVASRERELHNWRLGLRDKEAILEWLNSHAKKSSSS